jgi:serine/threonine-protein kinase
MAPPPYPPRDPGHPRPYEPPSKPARRRWPLIAGAVAAVVVIAAVVTGVLVTGGGDGGQPDYKSQTFTHAHGTTDMTAAPTAVAALGPGDGDAVLSLGLQPVAIGTTSGALPSWEKAAITGTPKILSGLIDTAAVAAAKPDVIIATGDVDDTTYGKLASIAPTITRPADAATPWTWQDQLTWIGKIVGRDAEAKELVDSVRSQADDVKNQNPSFNGKSVAALTVSDGGVGEILRPSNTATFLESVGLRYDNDLERTPADRGDSRPLPDASLVYQLKTEVLVVLRTDKAAGEGGYGGLPAPFSAYTGAMIIADTPDVLAALAEPGGYLATQFLYQNFVPTMAGQIR